MGIFDRLLRRTSTPRIAAHDGPPLSHEMWDRQRAFVEAAIETALNYIVDGGSMLPFVLVDGPEGTPVPQAVGDRYVLSADLTMTKWLAASYPDRSICLWDGYLTSSGRRTDAIFATLYLDRAEYPFAQRYVPAVSGHQAQVTENLSYLGEVLKKPE